MDSTTAPRLSVFFPDNAAGTDNTDAQAARLRTLLAVAGRLAVPDEREEAINALAQTLGVDAVALFVRDREIDVLLPARGFPQTLPGGKQWKEFLDRCTKDGICEGDLPFPKAGTRVAAVGVAYKREAALVLLGGSPDRPLLAEAEYVLPLLAFAFRGEQALLVAEGHAALAQRTAQESRELAAILDGARAELQRALADAQEQRAQVRHQAAELAAIFQALPGAVIMCDLSGRLVHTNAQAEALLRAALGRMPQQLSDGYGSGWPLHPDGRPMSLVDHPLAQALRGNAQAEVRCMMRRAVTGEEVHLLMGAEPMRDEAGHIMGAVAIATDITHLHRLEREKDEFLSIASHELRTPLTTILANAHLAQRRVLRLMAKATALSVDLHPELQDLQRLLARSTTAAERQKRLADDLLDVSRIAVGHLVYRPEPCDLSAIVREYVEELRVANPARDITLDVPPLPLQIMADVDRIGQVVTNYVSNALKYSLEDKSVAVSVEAVSDRVRVQVRDQGPGLPPNEHEQIWERFHRADGISPQYGSGVGLGLGLYICKTIVERHAGQVGIDSAPGAGSTFWFELPLLPATLADPPAIAR